MRNRTWLAVVAGVAVVAVAVQFRIARSQEGKAKGMRKKAAAAAEHAGMSSKVTYAIAMVEGLGDHKVKGKVSLTCDAWQADSCDGYFAVCCTREPLEAVQGILRSKFVGFACRSGGCFCKGNV